MHPLLQRPAKVQLAALCYKIHDDGKKVLLITSRGTGRWIIPKGWPISGTSSVGTALQEAWEEAGVVKGKTHSQPLGSYDYDKWKDSGWSIPVRTVVYTVAVEEIRDDFPEADERKRKWVAPKEAAQLVQEPELKRLLLDFEKNPV